ncbi:glycosyltransferase family 4 protein [Kaistella sp. 97-N-M2]|uniref:glycosyltransferase family 4 protein n=1 Tax=Kaistella sp. 97-N-M2 TaxID=2908645 RepID=UPI001F1BFA78|nr:glycosyltransferase family 4 protein [Kaistella sp. 97-N-M2]UJF28777.1 glycosyltransferase family 4 protein [Kaistella sp. 97-N-M2]
MKILYLTDQTYLHGGIEKVLSHKANYLADVLGDEVIIVTYNQKGRKPVYAFSAKIQMFDLDINYEIGKSYFHPINLKKIPAHRNALLTLLCQLKPDVVISCSFGPDFYFLPYLEKQIPKIKEFHGSRFFYTGPTASIKKRFLQHLNRLIEEKYECIAVLNESEKAFYTNSHITIIPNPAELTAEQTDYISKKILAAGRISPVKNFSDLIEAFARLSKDFPEWELHFFGEDYLSTQQKLEDQVRTLGLNDKVKFKGVTSDLKKEMQHYSIYAVTSETECFPMVLLEALSVDIPIVTYDSPTGPQHIVRNGNDSFLVPYKNLDIFTAQLKMLMSDENLRRKMGRAARENVQRFSIDKVMQQWKDLFTHLTTKP